MKLPKIFSAAAPSAILCSLYSSNALAATSAPPTGNTETSAYIWILVIAGVLLAAAAVAGIITGKKK